VLRGIHRGAKPGRVQSKMHFGSFDPKPVTRCSSILMRKLFNACGCSFGWRKPRLVARKYDSQFAGVSAAPRKRPSQLTLVGIAGGREDDLVRLKDMGDRRGWVESILAAPLGPLPISRHRSAREVRSLRRYSEWTLNRPSEALLIYAAYFSR